MKAKNVLAFTPILSAVLTSACSQGHDESGRVSDVIGAKVVKKLLQNIPLNRDFELTMVGFGYRQGSNCVQQIEETNPSGEKKTVVRFFRATCPNFPIETAPIGELRILRIPLNNKQVIYFGSLPVGELDDRGAIDNLCFGVYAKRCDVILGDDGSISMLQAKEVPGSWPVIAPNSPSEKALLWIVNHFEQNELLTTGLTEDEAATVFSYRSTTGDFLTISDIAEHGKVSAASGFLLLDYARFSGLEKISADLQASSLPLSIVNQCSHPIRMAIMALAESLKWGPVGWFQVGSNESKYPALAGDMVRLLSKSLLIYAETTDSANRKWQGDLNFAFAGKMYPFVPWKTYRTVGGSLVIKLKCE